MVNERRSERSSSLFTRAARKVTGLVPKPASFTNHLGLEMKPVESCEINKTPTSNMTTKTSPAVAKTVAKTDSRRPSVAKDTEEKHSIRLPPIPINSSYSPRKTKVTFLPPNQQVVQRRRLSIPEESLNRIPKSILKKRHSVSTDYRVSAPEDMSILCCLPWERELYLPPIANNGMLVFLDEDGSLPPMLRRLSNADTYNYSQEFLQVLDDLKNRPSS